MSQPTLAITGGTGFVGATLISLAVARGWAVRALTRKPQNPKDGVTWVAGALDDPRALYELANGSDAVIHVAGVVNAPDRAGFEQGNVAGTLAVVEAAKQARVSRFVHVSSLAAREPQLSNYSWSKARAEQIVQTSGLYWTIIRPPAIYGPGDKDMLDIYKMSKLGIVLLPPKGRLSLLEVSDLARLLLAVVPEAETVAQIYEPDDGAADGWTYSAYGKAIGWAMGGNVKAFHAPRPVLKFAAKVDRLFRRKKAKLTADRVSYMCHPNWVIDPLMRPPPALWKPEVTTRSGLKATARAYRTQGWL